jgi:hypothetical protein
MNINRELLRGTSRSWRGRYGEGIKLNKIK